MARFDPAALLLVLFAGIAVAGMAVVLQVSGASTAPPAGTLPADVPAPSWSFIDRSPPPGSAAGTARSTPRVVATRPPAPSPTVAPAPKPTPTRGTGSSPSASRPSPPQAAAAPSPFNPQRAGPVQTVVAFYRAVARHDWDRAIAIWSPRMRQQYPPDMWLIERFADTTRIVITRLQTIALDEAGGSATVAVTLVEYRTVAPSPRTFVGSWDLVRIDGLWYLDQPHF